MGGGISPAGRILAAADTYHAMIERRPYRAARSASEASAEVRAGRLDGGTVDAVLHAAGHRVGTRREWPAGLAAREVEVLRLVARGFSNKEIAAHVHSTRPTTPAAGAAASRVQRPIRWHPRARWCSTARGLLIGVNAGSNTVYSFEVNGRRLSNRTVAASGGSFPVSVAVHGDLAYVLNAKDRGSVSGYRIAGRKLHPIENSTRSLGLVPATGWARFESAMLYPSSSSELALEGGECRDL